jgi:hypothetical protein
VYHTDGYVAEGVDVAACDVADAVDGVHVVEVVNVTAVVGRINVDDAGI